MPSADPYTQAVQALEQGRGAEAANLLLRALKRSGLSRDDQAQIRCALAEAWLLQDDVRQAAEALGRPPENRERLDPARLSHCWRMHGRLAKARGEPSRGIALLTKALAAAERAHDSRAIGLAHYELGLCYRVVGDTAIVREHITQAASALHAAGDRRHLAMVHSLSGVALAEEGRLDEAMAALRQAERLAVLVEAGDVLATVCGNQANVALMQHRHEQALELAERSVQLQEESGTPHGLGMALASLGQICVRLGNLNRAEEALNRALDVRSPLLFMRETTGAVFDTLAQISLTRGNHEAASRFLVKAREAYGDEGGQTNRWYLWSIRVLEGRLALRRGEPATALGVATAMSRGTEVPSGYALQAELIVVEALLASGRTEEAQQHLDSIAGRINPNMMSSTWGEYLRLRGRLLAAAGRSTEAYHALGQSVSVFDLLGERHQAGLSYLELGRLAAAAGARSRATRYLQDAVAVFESLGAQPDLLEARHALASVPVAGTGEYLGVQMDGDDALVRRIVDAAVMPALLAREGVTALLEACDAQAVVLFVQPSPGQLRVLAAAGCDGPAARALALAATRSAVAAAGATLLPVEPLGRDAAGARFVVMSSQRPLSSPVVQRFRTLCAVLRQGFDLCSARDRPIEVAPGALERPLEPLLPGFVCASAAMQRVADQIQRLQGNDLTVLITGESGTGKDLVARAIHAGSPRRTSMFLPYNCTSATRELADSQLFGHRRGSFTGAVADQPGVLRTAVGGTLFLDEVGDLPQDVQPKLLRFLEQGEVLPVGDTRPQRVDVRVVAATNADLEQRVAEGKFREDLFYRLSVIRIHVPPLRERREEIPHLSTFFLRDASERLGKPGVQLHQETLDLFDAFSWPGNVRQLRNEVQRAVAMATPGGIVTPDLLSPVFAAARGTGEPSPRTRGRRTTLASAIEELERELISNALERSAGNISKTARSLGLTRRGLYLKMQRLGVTSGRVHA
ncbi:MAG TPA: sigma 54-interacting transcriptional regulator [Vicinamibacterales bacterium]|nr:sigma 54-interacting transcriptional regulator [Vicinamibacterales bacterium]